MRAFELPRISWQSRSQLSEDSLHSLLISLLRGAAALQVALAHLRAEVFPSLRSVPDAALYFKGLAFATGFAHQAVVVFFIISGWLVGGSLLNKLGQPQAVRSYAIDRATRLWTVLVPALLLMALVAIVAGRVDPAQADFAPSNEYSLATWLGNLLGLQTVLVPNFGGNYALWSLANETWYYVLFPLLLLAIGGRSVPRQLAAVAAISAIGLLLPWAITLYFVLWLLGAAFSRVRIECSTAQQVALVMLGACISVYYRLSGSNDDLAPASFVQDLVCSVPLLLLLSSLQRKVDPASQPLRVTGRIAKVFSEFSFTLYVSHVPIIVFLRYAARTAFGRDQLAVNQPLDLLAYFGVAALVVGAAYVSYLLFESQTYRVRRMVKQIFLQRAPEPRVAAVSTE
jgi:peptidoglycan/LPS O-acetylase OafA/YrhL